MWIIATYNATTLFSLKPATATASGGQTLLVPTPFAVKMALLDVACRHDGLDAARSTWPEINALTIAIRPPQQVVVNNTFIKVLKPRRNPAPPGSQDEGHFGKTITYREYAYLHSNEAGDFTLALWTDTTNMIDPLTRWLAGINYLGKRGSFIQLVEIPRIADELTTEFVVVDGDIGQPPLDAIMTQLDDTTDRTTFDRVDIYSGKSLKNFRTLHHTVLPYRRTRSSRSYTLYERTDTEAL